MLYCPFIDKDTTKMGDIIKQGKTITNLIQVTETLYDTKTRQREIDSLIDAMTELNVKESLILTFDDEETVHIKNKKIVIKPVYKWLLE